MAVDLNHIIVVVSDPAGSAKWYADLFGLAPPERFGHFWQVSTGNGVNLDFDQVGASRDAERVHPQHYAFLVSEAEFEEIFGRITERGIDHYADPAGRRKGEINHNDGGRGVYFPDPDGHWLEIITRPYGSGA